MPGKRIEKKRIDQLLLDGSVIVNDKDQKFSPKEFKEILSNLFPDLIEENGRMFLKTKNPKEKTIGFYTRNIYHLGGNWSSEKKRIEIGKDFLKFYNDNQSKGIITILLGCYHYYPDSKSGVLLFVCFSANTYATKKTNNSAAHIHTLDLQNALKYGYYRRLDRSNNELLVFDKTNFINYINTLRRGETLPAIEKDKQLLEYLGNIYTSIPKNLYGIQCYKQMFADNDSNRKQAAWEGWYVEYYVKKFLTKHPNNNITWWSSKRKESLDFDLKFLTEENFYGDIKADDAQKNIQGNKKSNIDFLIKEQKGRLWYIVFEFTPDKDSNHQFVTTKWWNTKLQKRNLLSYSTRMKFSIVFENMNVYEINSNTLKYLKEYSVSPCQGKSREVKYKIPNKIKKFLKIYQQI